MQESKNVVREAVELICAGEVESGHICKRVLVIDEAQDMDENEFALIEALMERNPDMRVIAVGDDDQNIYAFRGSDSGHLRTLIDKYGAKHYDLLENYRSAPQIPFDRKKFNPHITLLRKAQISRENPFRFSDVKVGHAELTVRNVSLMRSDFGKRGAVYTEVGAVSGQES